MARFSHVSTALEPERAIVVGLELPGSHWPVNQSLSELERLAQTAGALPVGRVTQRLSRPVSRTLIGSGKVDELKGLVERLCAQIVIFDDELTPSQQMNLECLIGDPIKIIDRTALILDIFGLHAQTHEGRLQVQLAQLQYLLPRLRGMWSHLAKEQTRGGIGSRFGQGESQLEVDRRLIRNRIASLRHELSRMEQRRGVQSKQRERSSVYRVALAGYTNAGKSTFLNTLTDADVLSQDKLFATLDPTTRSLSLPGGRSVTLTDTVGFIQKLPHQLVKAFSSTLAEVLSADLIIKVIDASDPDWKQQLEAVEEVLEEIHAGERQSVCLFNKIDLLSSEELARLTQRYPDSLVFSSRTQQGLEDLLSYLMECVASKDRVLTLLLPFSEGRLLAQIRSEGQVLAECYDPQGMDLTVRVPPHLAGMLQRYEGSTS